MNASRPAVSSSGKNQRPCPALNGVIKPADCGAQRGSKLACPPDCAYFPFGFGAAEAFRKVDDICAGKILGFLRQHLGMATMGRLMRGVEKLLSRPRENQMIIATHLLYHGLLGYHRSDGRTAADLWEAQNWEGLNNDERYLMRHRRQARLTVIEVQRIEPPDRIQVLDLFDPSQGQLLIRDASMSTRLVRFSRLFTWITPFPHFHDIPGSAFTVPAHVWPGWRAQIQARYELQKTQQPELSWPRFFLDNFIDSVRLISEQSNVFRQQLTDSMDLQACAAIYRPTVPVADLEAWFRSRGDFLGAEAPALQDGQGPPTAFYQWCFQGESADLAKELPAPPTLPIEIPKKNQFAKVWLYPDRLVIETLSLPKHRLARRMADQYLGAMANFEREVIYDLAQLQAREQEAAQAIGEASAWLDDAVPEPTASSPRTATVAPNQEGPVAAEQQQRSILERHQKFYGQYLDATQPALDGKTPREAAQDPGLRPRLVELIKHHINHLEVQNQQTGLNLNLDELLQELGLPELRG